MRAALSIVLAATVATVSSVAGAQDLNTAAAQPTAATSTGGSVTDTSGITDHAVVTGRIGLRYFGSTSVPALSFQGGMVGAGGSQSLHTVGMRYWLNGALGLEAGLTLGFASGGTTTTQQSGGMTTTVSNDNPNFFGIGVHAGLPIMLAEAKHVSIYLTPYLDLIYGTSSITTGSGMGTTDNSLGAFTLRLGANAAAELQFGFLGVPQLGLIAQFGFGVDFTSISGQTVVLSTNDTTTTSTSAFRLGTTVGPNYGLADIISGSISAVWYFGGAPGAQR